MNIVFVSNYFNHHQKYLSDALYNSENVDFHFIATSAMREERKKLGYEIELPEYVIDAHADSNRITYAKTVLHSSNIIICGAADMSLVKPYINKDKFFFRYSERPLKKGFEILKYPYRFVKLRRNNPQYKNSFLLCSGAYVAGDFAKFGLFRGRAFKWGYFPETKHYDTDSLFNKKDPTMILWCGRFLDWKHPDDAISVARRLKNDGYRFKLNIIGTGEMENLLRQMIGEYHLEDCVYLTGPQSPEKIRLQMEHSGIYLFTSDRREGWGAVLNESMNSGCALVASHAIGAVPFLLKNHENGLIYKSGDVDELCRHVEFLLDNPAEQRALGECAYRTISEEWNAEIAANRFLNLTKSIIGGTRYPALYNSGPCSKANLFEDDWY